MAEEVVKLDRPPMEIVWRNVIKCIFFHLAALFGIYLTNRRIFACELVFLYTSSLGVTAGAHRLWAHRSYKAKWPLRVFLMLCQTMAMQNSIYEWCRDHRVHHKYSETDADPHNAKRGFFFAHMGWLMVRKHPDVKEKGKAIDMSDLSKDLVVAFQKKYYHLLFPAIGILLPVMVPIILWRENFCNSLFTVFFTRYILSLHGTWLVNSAAHLWGNRPYDKKINPRDNRCVSYFAIGEGFHNYHHTFPWDYSASEFGWFFNFTCFFIDFMAWLGLAYDRKKATAKLINERKDRTGDTSAI